MIKLIHGLDIICRLKSRLYLKTISADSFVIFHCMRNVNWRPKAELALELPTRKWIFRDIESRDMVLTIGQKKLTKLSFKSDDIYNWTTKSSSQLILAKGGELNFEVEMLEHFKPL